MRFSHLAFVLGFVMMMFVYTVESKALAAPVADPCGGEYPKEKPKEKKPKKEKPKKEKKTLKELKKFFEEFMKK